MRSYSSSRANASVAPDVSRSGTRSTLECDRLPAPVNLQPSILESQCNCSASEGLHRTLLSLSRSPRGWLVLSVIDSPGSSYFGGTANRFLDQ
jgi:hypothetical protein